MIQTMMMKNQTMTMKNVTKKMMPRMMRQGMRKDLKMKPEMRMKYITLLVIMHKYIIKVRNTIASKMKK
jgi:hypothetical protein